MRQLYEDDFWVVNINWSKPMKYENLVNQGSYKDDSAYLYMITGKYSNNVPKLFYIGKTYKQYVSMRLTQKDHQERYAELCKEYPKHILYVNHGIIEIEEGNRTEKRVDEIERILIYSMDSEHSVNQKNYFSHGVTAQYLIYNYGYKSILPSKIGLGVFIK